MSLEQTGAHKASLHRSGSSGPQTLTPCSITSRAQQAHTHPNQAGKYILAGHKRNHEHVSSKRVIACTDTPKTHTNVRASNMHALKWAGWSGSAVAQINGVSQY